MKASLSVLIVDDHPGIYQTLRDILESEGYTVVTARTGNEAIARAQEQEFDVILMDVRMPDLNGIEAFRRIKSFSQKTRVIMMSAFSVEELKREALQEGAVAFLKKPLDVEKVLKLIEQTEQPPVLVVVDDEEERNTLAEYLGLHKYRAYTTRTAEEALKLAGQIRFAVIMIDTKLSPMNGLELYLALKQITPTSIAIMLAHTDKTFVEQAEEERVYFSKETAGHRSTTSHFGTYPETTGFQYGRKTRRGTS